MPLIVLVKVDRGYRVSVHELFNLYPIYFDEIRDLINSLKSKYSNHYTYDIKSNTYAETIVLSAYNYNKKKLKDLSEYWLIPLDLYPSRYNMVIYDLIKKHSLPVGYYIVLAIYGIRVTINVVEKFSRERKHVESVIKVYPILPDSIEKVGFNENTHGIWEDVEEKMEFINKIAREYGTWSMVVDTPLSNVVSDLMEASARYNMGDYEGAVKFYRKVIEGMKNFLQNVDRVDGSEKRADALLDFSKKAFHLISNFGEHFGTSGGPEEAELARNITLDLLKYIMLKFKQKRIELKQAQ